MKDFLHVLLDESAHYQVCQELVGGGGADGGAVELVEAVGEALHVLLVGTAVVEPAAEVELADEARGRGGGDDVATSEGVGCCVCHIRLQVCVCGVGSKVSRCR